jgi:hypothetical protein
LKISVESETDVTLKVQNQNLNSDLAETYLTPSRCICECKLLGQIAQFQILVSTSGEVRPSGVIYVRRDFQEGHNMEEKSCLLWAC